MIIWTTVIFLILIIFQRRYITRLFEFIKLVRFSRTLPGPPFLELYTKKKGTFDWLIECRQKYGPLFSIWLGGHLFIFITDPNDAQLILSSNIATHKSNNHQIIESWLGQGLLTNNGDNWHMRRKLLTPAFHFKVLSSFREPMEDSCRILIDKLSKVADGKPFDIYPYITLFALDVICETAMGIKKNAQQNSESEYVKAVKGMCDLIAKRLYSLNRINLIYYFSSARQTEIKLLKILHGETDRIIESRRKFIDAEEITNTNKNRLAFLDMLLLAQKESGKLTDRNIREEVDTFMFEGHDTTSSALSWIIYSLSIRKDVQDRCYESLSESDDVGDSKKSYLDAVIKESLRLYPPVPLHSRELQEPFKLGDRILPKGTSVSIFQYMLHRDPTTYKNPEEFNPDRFSYDDEKDMNPFANVPFSAGPRNCIGQRFAMLELKCTMRNLIQTFEFLPADDFIPNPNFLLILKSTNGIRVRLLKRN